MFALNERVLTQVVEDIRDDVRCIVQTATDSGVKFTMQGDTWKPKMKRRRHYLAVYLNWLTPEFRPMELCIQAVPVEAPRTGEASF